MFRLLLSAVALAPVALTVGALSMTAVPPAAPAHAADAHCELKASKRGGATTLEGFVTSPSAISGSYRISVNSTGSGGGGSDIDQSGAFSAKAGSPVSLGVVTIGGPSGNYSAELTVKHASGGTMCTGHSSGKI